MLLLTFTSSVSAETIKKRHKKHGFNYKKFRRKHHAKTFFIRTFNLNQCYGNKK